MQKDNVSYSRTSRANLKQLVKFQRLQGHVDLTMDMLWLVFCSMAFYVFLVVLFPKTDMFNLFSSQNELSLDITFLNKKS